MAGPFMATRGLDAPAFAAVRRRAMLEQCKWDAQIGDISTLCSFPLVLQPPAWALLSNAAEALTAEVFEAETRLLARPHLLDSLGLPWRIVRVLKDARGPLAVSAGRIMRFDFHWTTEGWRISEVNSDVPGGYCESTGFTDMMMAGTLAGRATGSPGQAWAAALAEHVRGGVAVLVSAPGLMEDQQVNYYLARLLTELDVPVHVAGPRQVQWQDGRAVLHSVAYTGPIDVIWRFYQAEWLSRFPVLAGWSQYFRGSRTPVANPGVAIVTESKRLPLIWDALDMPFRAFRQYLPETLDPRHAPWRTDASWLVKSAFCCTGESVHGLGITSETRWRDVQRDVARHPHDWVAQRRFDTVPIQTPLGPVHPCVGVYTINGKVAGCYGRLTSGSVIDFEAMDVAVLIGEEVRNVA